ncbi:hypothetical protein TRFO_02319 [Tritrichomonas foetus]|uniref:Uncharacterized protein n=1 Tax=Tritrichomonas foetus TaxID=1144522 RepID=A0A1J4J9A3_9EUKA|nr:hypothetical protein TRFO_02319 [Tritrichomonas foetus]|eukprot:OHS93804.1 hypothetical protein TRFO_02319 [Tritrichomonas foetus]
MNEKKVYQKTTTRDLMITATYPHIELYEKVRQLPSATIYYYHKLLPFLHEAFEYIKNRIKDSGDIQNQNIQFKRLKFKKKKIASNSRFFMIPPNIEILKKLLNLIDSSNATNKIIFIPRISDECNDLLNTVNSSSNNSQILVESYNFDFIPLSEKIMIIPLVDFFYETFSRQKLSLLQICSQVLLTLQLFYGKIPNVRIHGSKSKKFYDMFSEMKSKIPENNFPSSQMFSNLIIIDRMVDPLTPLLLQNS